MRTEAEIRERLAKNRDRLNADRIASSLEHRLIEENALIVWVLGE